MHVFTVTFEQFNVYLVKKKYFLFFIFQIIRQGINNLFIMMHPIYRLNRKCFQILYFQLHASLSINLIIM